MHIRPDDIETMSFDWGTIKWFATPSAIKGAASTLGEVIIMPGKGHDRHNHPGAEELIYVISGEAEQTVGDDPPFTIREGDVVHVPVAAYHSTFNRIWRPLRLIVTYTPGGEERALVGLPGYQRHPSGSHPQWRRTAE